MAPFENRHHALDEGSLKLALSSWAWPWRDNAMNRGLGYCVDVRLPTNNEVSRHRSEHIGRRA